MLPPDVARAWAFADMQDVLGLQEDKVGRLWIWAYQPQVCENSIFPLHILKISPSFFPQLLLMKESCCPGNESALRRQRTDYVEVSMGAACKSSLHCPHPFQPCNLPPLGSPPRWGISSLKVCFPYSIPSSAAFNSWRAKATAYIFLWLVPGTQEIITGLICKYWISSQLLKFLLLNI